MKCPCDLSTRHCRNYLQEKTWKGGGVPEVQGPLTHANYGVYVENSPFLLPSLASPLPLFFLFLFVRRILERKSSDSQNGLGYVIILQNIL